MAGSIIFETNLSLTASTFTVEPVPYKYFISIVQCGLLTTPHSQETLVYFSDADKTRHCLSFQLPTGCQEIMEKVSAVWIKQDFSSITWLTLLAAGGPRRGCAS